MVEFATTLHLEEREKVVQQRIDQYFEQQGYRAKYDSHDDIYYERGSALGNYIAINLAS